jgi:hypothetical protein
VPLGAENTDDPLFVRGREAGEQRRLRCGLAEFGEGTCYATNRRATKQESKKSKELKHLLSRLS